MTCYLYAKYEGMRTFKAYDINENVFPGNLMYATILENTEDNTKILQNIADDNANINLILQLRNKGKIIFQTT